MTRPATRGVLRGLLETLGAVPPVPGSFAGWRWVYGTGTVWGKDEGLVLVRALEILADARRDLARFAAATGGTLS